MSRISRDSILYDSFNDSSIGYVRKVVQESAVPNTLRTRKEFDGFFIKKIDYLEGDFLFDSHLASYVSSNFENFSDIKNDIFICLVYVPELHHIDKDSLPSEPSGKEFEALIEKLLASRKGVFKRYDYQGEEPTYMAPVKVSFADTDSFEDPLFENPLAGGGAKLPGGGFGPGAAAGLCGQVGAVNTTVGNAGNANNAPAPVVEEDLGPYASAKITVTNAEEFLAQPSILKLISTSQTTYNINFNPDLIEPTTLGTPPEKVIVDGTTEEVTIGTQGVEKTDNGVAEFLAEWIGNEGLWKDIFTTKILSLTPEGGTGPDVSGDGGTPSGNTGVIRTADCDEHMFTSKHNKYPGGKVQVFQPKNHDFGAPVDIMLWLHGNGGLGDRAKAVIDKGPGLPANENIIFIAPRMSGNPGSGGSVANPYIESNIISDIMNQLRSKVNPTAAVTSFDNYPNIRSIRAYGWSGGGSPLSQFGSSWFRANGLNPSGAFEKFKVFRYLDADYGNKDHINFAREVQDDTFGTAGREVWKRMVSWVVQTKYPPGDKGAKPLEFSWAKAPEYPKKGNEERHSFLYPDGIPIYILDASHTECGWQTADIVGGATATPQASPPPQKAIVRIKQEVPGTAGNTQILFTGEGLSFVNFSKGKDVAEANAPEPAPTGDTKPPGDGTTPAPADGTTPTGTGTTPPAGGTPAPTPPAGGAAPEPTPEPTPAPAPENTNRDEELFKLLNDPSPTGALPENYVRQNPILIYKAAAAFYSGPEDVPAEIAPLMKYLTVKKHYDSLISDYYTVDPQGKEFFGGTPLEGKEEGDQAYLQIGQVFKPFLTKLKEQLEGTGTGTTPGGAASVGAPQPSATPAEPSAQEVANATPNVAQPAPAAAPGPCGSYGAPGVSGPPGSPVPLGSTPGEPGAYASAIGGIIPLTSSDYIGSDIVIREIVAVGSAGSVGGTGYGPASFAAHNTSEYGSRKWNKANGITKEIFNERNNKMYFPEGGEGSHFPAYSTPVINPNNKIGPNTPLNSVVNVSQEYMRKDVARYANAVGRELRSLGCVFYFDSTRRPLKANKDSPPGNHWLGLAIDLAPAASLTDPDQDVYVCTPDFVYKNRLYWRIYARSIGFSGIDNLIANKKVISSKKDEWYVGDSMPGNQVPHITINAAYIRKNPEDKKGKLFFRPTTGPFVDLTAIMFKHGFTPIGAKDNKGKSAPFFDFPKAKAAEYGLSEGSISQGLPLKGFPGAEWWHFEHLATNNKHTTSYDVVNRIAKEEKYLQIGRDKADDYATFEANWQKNKFKKAKPSAVNKDKRGVELYGSWW